jgi:hypothetical protein
VLAMLRRFAPLLLLCACGGKAVVDGNPCIRPDDAQLAASGDGYDQLSSPGGVHAFDLGPDMNVVVSTDSCCWLVEVYLSDTRSTAPRFCQLPQGGLELVQTTEVLREPSQNYFSYSWECDPGDVLHRGMQPGDAYQHACSGVTPSGTHLRNATWTYVGPDTLELGTRAVAAYRFRETALFSGTISGEQTNTFWLAQDDRWLLGQEHSATVVLPGAITSDESWSWRLAP